MTLPYLVLLPPAAYLLGSVPFGLVLTRLAGAADIRAAGSGNIGATNVARVAGRRLGALTLLADALKGALPVLAAVALTGRADGWPALYVSLVALAAFAGHLFPLYTRGRGGGKGVATAAGCFAVISPGPGAVALLVFVLVFCLTDRVSAASLAGAALLPIAVHHSSRAGVFTACAAACCLLIFARHRANIGRLLRGAEPPLTSPPREQGPDQR